MRVDSSSAPIHPSMNSGTALKDAFWKRTMEYEQAAQWFLAINSVSDGSLPSNRDPDHPSSDVNHPLMTMNVSKLRVTQYSTSIETHDPAEDTSADRSPSSSQVSHKVGLIQATVSTPLQDITLPMQDVSNMDSDLLGGHVKVVNAQDRNPTYSTTIRSSTDSLELKPMVELQELNAQTISFSLPASKKISNPFREATPSHISGLEPQHTPVVVNHANQPLSSGGDQLAYWRGQCLYLNLPQSWAQGIQLDKLVLHMRATLLLHGYDPSAIIVNRQTFDRPVPYRPELASDDKLHLVSL